MYGVRTQRDCGEMNDALKARLASPWVQEFIRATRLVWHLPSNSRLNDPQAV